MDNESVNQLLRDLCSIDAGSLALARQIHHKSEALGPTTDNRDCRQIAKRIFDVAGIALSEQEKKLLDIMYQLKWSDDQMLEFLSGGRLRA